MCWQKRKKHFLFNQVVQLKDFVVARSERVGGGVEGITISKYELRGREDEEKKYVKMSLPLR